MIKEKISTIYKEALAAFNSVAESKALYDEKVRYLGKQGLFSQVMREMGALPKAERPLIGQMVNQKKSELEEVYARRDAELKTQELNQLIEKDSLDLSLPGPARRLGSLHPVRKVIDDVVDIFSRLGYSVRTGPLVEKDFYNFEALNIPKGHPSRDMQDTFYIDEEHVLRTHTSPIQIHSLEDEKPPLRIIAPGPTFRCDSDISHLPNFHQIELMLVDKKVSMADLKGTISFFLREFFGTATKLRFRPSFFPFTEPSAEVDCSCPICKGKGCRMCGHSGWVEIGGCGLVNPKVFEMAKLDPKEWQGMAFGFGIERMGVIKYGVEDVRLYPENDIRFLSQF